MFHVDFSLCYWLLRCFSPFYLFFFEFFDTFSISFLYVRSPLLLLLCLSTLDIFGGGVRAHMASRQPTLLAAVPKVRPVHHLVADGSERVYITGRDHQTKILKVFSSSFLLPRKAANDGILYTRNIQPLPIKVTKQTPQPQKDITTVKEQKN